MLAKGIRRFFSTSSNKDLQMIFVDNALTPKPAPNPKYPRLYGHALCPYVERVRLALSARAVEFQRCEINLKDKTQWHQGINGGLVPILELPDGTILLDSKILMDYANDAYPNQGYSTLPENPVHRAKMRMAVPNVAEAFFTSWTSMLAKRVASEDDMKAFNSKLQNIEDFITKNGNDKSHFLMGTPNPTQLDIHTYACLARPYFTKDSVFHETFFTKM